MQLIDQAQTLIERNQPDAAIAVLERAVSIHPANGQSFYYLAEAWLLKGNRAQASEFNRMATRYLEKEPGWQVRVFEQKVKIRKTADEG
jgi:predicted Zn-dependent protease